MSLISKHWPGIESFNVNGVEYQLSMEEVQAHDRWMDEKQREMNPSIGGLTLIEEGNEAIKGIL